MYEYLVSKGYNKAAGYIHRDSQNGRIIIKRSIFANQWQKYGENKLKIEGNVLMLIRNIKTIAAQPLGR